MVSEKNTRPTWGLYPLAAVTGLWLLLNLVALPLAWGGIKASGGTLGAIQTLVLLGFALAILFDLVSLGWLFFRGRSTMESTAAIGLGVLGCLSFLAMMGAKVMVDEIARETPLGGAGGEWGILYACLVLQLSYIVVFLFRTKPVRR